MLKFKMNQANPDASGGGASPPSVVDTPPPATPDTPPPATNTQASWLDSLPDDIKKDPSLQMFKEPSALAKSWVNAQKMIGAKAVQIPGDNATDEEVAAFYNKLGRPESADKYEIKLPDGKVLDDGFAKGLKETAHKAGLNPKQLQNLVNWYEGQTAELQKAHEAQAVQKLKNDLDAYKEKLGGDDKFKAQIDKARMAVQAVAGDEFKAFLKETGLGSRPEAIEFFAKIAGMMSEDKLRDGTGVPFNNEDPVKIQAEINNLEAQMFSDTSSPKMQDWVTQRNSLYERLSLLRAKGAQTA